VFYKGSTVGKYFADILLNDAVLIELKVADRLIEPHEAQLINYLRATKTEVGLLLNFGPAPAYKRKLYTNNRKEFLSILFDA